MADDDIREGAPKKKPRPRSEDDEDDRPRKKRPADDDDDDDRPKKSNKIAKDDDDGNDLGSSPLSAVVPVGGSIWALLSFYLALLSCVVPLPLLGLLAAILGVVAFMTHKHKASYGSITGNMRAVLGIVIGLITMVGSTIILIMFFSGAFR